jgi:hypothetical protein
MPDEDVHLHPSRPPTEAEHHFARAIVGVLRFLRDSAAVVASLAGVAAFARGATLLLSGRAGDPTVISGLYMLWTAIVAVIGVLILLVYIVEWVKWASVTKPVWREHDGDWRDLEP